jgi:broad specificity phosphatase PhoE
MRMTAIDRYRNDAQSAQERAREAVERLGKAEQELRLIRLNLGAPEGADLSAFAYRLTRQRDALIGALALVGEMSGGQGTHQVLKRLA